MLVSGPRTKGIEMRKKDWESTLEPECGGCKRSRIHSIGNEKLSLSRKLFYNLSVETRNIDHLSAHK